MDPRGSLLFFGFFYTFFTIFQTRTDTDREQVVLAICCTGRDSILGPRSSGGFFLISLPVAAADSVPFLCTSSPWASYIIAQVMLILVRWLTRWGVILGSAKANSLHACVPSPGLELASAPLTLVKHHTRRKVACLCPQSYV